MAINGREGAARGSGTGGWRGWTELVGVGRVMGGGERHNSPSPASLIPWSHPLPIHYPPPRCMEVFIAVFIHTVVHLHRTHSSQENGLCKYFPHYGTKIYMCTDLSSVEALYRGIHAHNVIFVQDTKKAVNWFT